MGRTPSTSIPFGDDDLAEVCEVMTELSEAGRGWINFHPSTEEGFEPAPRSMAAWLFSGRGEPVPLATWKPSGHDGSPVSVGIEHGAGSNALAHLADTGNPMPTGWMKVSDHARRGLVLSVPADAPADAVLRWLIAACRSLAPMPLTDEWTAVAYRP